MRKSTEEYLIERCRTLEAQVEQQEVTIQLLSMQRDEIEADSEEANDTLEKILRLFESKIFVAPDAEDEKLRYISLSAWEKYNSEDFNFLEMLLKERNLIEVPGWEEVNV